MTLATKKAPEEIRLERRRQRLSCSGLIVAALFPKKGENLGTLARTCDAVGACLAAPDNPLAVKAIRKGNTIGDRGFGSPRSACSYGVTSRSSRLSWSWAMRFTASPPRSGRVAVAASLVLYKLAGAS